MNMIVKNPARQTYKIHALEGSFRGVKYYMTTHSISECVDQLNIAPTEDAASFAERVQRRLDKKRAVEKIFLEYLATPGTRFFNSLVAVLTPKKGTTEYYKFEPFKDSRENKIGNVGMLEILSDIDRIVVDGQHRLQALMEADKASREPGYNKELGFGDIRVPVVYVTFDDVGGVFDEDNDVEDLSKKVAGRSRKLFVDLNKDVKKVDRNSLLVLDDSDFSAIAARFLIEHNESLERYTKWSTTGTTLADSDPFFTNIFLLDQYVEHLYAALTDIDLDNIANDYELELEEDRERALEKYFCSRSGACGLVPRNMIEEFFSEVSFFQQWKRDIKAILGDDPQIQPTTTEINIAQKRKIKDLHERHLLSTVAGQHAAFRAVLSAFEHIGSQPEENWKTSLNRLSVIHDKGILDRSYPLWSELLVRPGKKMKVTNIKESSDVISSLIRLQPNLSVIIHPDKGIGTDESEKYYHQALGTLQKALG